MAKEHQPALSLVTQGASPEAAAERETTMDPERKRRRTMSGLYADLAALLPNLSPRERKVRILEEAITRVKALRETAAELEAYAAAGRKGRGGGGGGEAVAEVVASGETSCFAVRLRSGSLPGALTRVLEVFQRHGVAVLAATVARNGGEGETALTVTTAAVAPAVLETVKAEIICIV